MTFRDCANRGSLSTKNVYGNPVVSGLINITQRSDVMEIKKY